MLLVVVIPSHAHAGTYTRNYAYKRAPLKKNKKIFKCQFKARIARLLPFFHSLCTDVRAFHRVHLYEMCTCVLTSGQKVRFF